MKRAFDENVENVEIKWTNPIHYENVFDMDEEKLYDAWFYKILAKSNNGKYKLLYIGKTERYVSDRLKDADHKRRIEKIKKDFPRHKIKLSLGNVVVPENLSSAQVDQIESLLVYTHSDLQYIENKKKKWAHRVKNEYTIINKGFRKDDMVKVIQLGVFYKY